MIATPAGATRQCCRACAAAFDDAKDKQRGRGEQQPYAEYQNSHAGR